MSNTRRFKTRTLYRGVENLKLTPDWPLALDIGYSGVKGMSPNAVFSFPAFAREMGNGILGESNKSDILYRDERGKQWYVGSLAQAQLGADDTADSYSTLFGRHRYFSPMYLVLARIGMAFGINSNNIQGYSREDVFIQTGLPPAWTTADTADLVEVLKGEHIFSAKLGEMEWTDYHFSISEDRISVIDQPMGALFSASKSDDGHDVMASSGRPITESRLLILDGGFGTLDVISVNNRRLEKEKMNSFTEVGMRGVFERVSQVLSEQYGVHLSVHAFQHALETGYVKRTDRRNLTSRSEPIQHILDACSRIVCEEAMEKVAATYSLPDYDYLLLAGGTCAAWKDQISEICANMELEVITADKNDDLGPVFSNVRGYYLYRAAALARP